MLPAALAAWACWCIHRGPCPLPVLQGCLPLPCQRKCLQGRHTLSSGLARRPAPHVASLLCAWTAEAISIQACRSAATSGALAHCQQTCLSSCQTCQGTFHTLHAEGDCNLIFRQPPNHSPAPSPWYPYHTPQSGCQKPSTSRQTRPSRQACPRPL